jgi:glycosyltransferase involved in cell wall biosynthesis
MVRAERRAYSHNARLVEPIVAFDARDAFAPELRGWGRYARCLLDALRGVEGIDLDVYTDGGVGPELLFEQVKLPLALRRRRAALIHAPNWFLPLARPCPGVVTVHDLAFERWPEDFVPLTRAKFRVLARLAARSAERVIVPSQFTADDVCTTYGVDRSLVRVIPYAAALPVGELAPPAGPYVLAVGDLRKKKNLAPLVSAYAELWRAGEIAHTLVLAGVDTGEGPRLRALAGDAPVELTGYIDDAQLDALMRGADLLVHPSLYEGFGLVLLEAMARGTPVLAAQATALPETGGDAAAYFDPSEPGGLRVALGRLLAAASERDELRRRGLARAAGFSWGATAELTAAVYRELV